MTWPVHCILQQCYLGNPKLQWRLPTITSTIFIYNFFCINISSSVALTMQQGNYTYSNFNDGTLSLALLMASYRPKISENKIKTTLSQSRLKPDSRPGSFSVPGFTRCMAQRLTPPRITTGRKSASRSLPSQPRITTGQKNVSSSLQPQYLSINRVNGLEN